MNRFIKYLFGLVLALTLNACTDWVDPAIPYNEFDTGLYLRTLDRPSSSFDFFNLDAGVFQVTIEAVDIEDGRTLREVEVFVSRRRGPNVTSEARLGTIPASAFQPHSFKLDQVHPASGSRFPAATIRYTLEESLTAMGMTKADIDGGDFIEYRLSATDTQGRVFTNTNLSPDIVGGLYYRSPFFYRYPVVCPSELQGTFDYVHTNMFCDGEITGTVTWTKATATTYNSTDFAFGSWQHCYGSGSGPNSSNTSVTLKISDACGVITLTGIDQFGDTYTYNIDNVSGTSLTISWENTYGEFGTVVLTRQDGKNWPPLRN
ncbi:MAG TPA: hypothetical protein PKC76_02340 [Saprospiraceae bacterium]|nr:hypothetical protein [Saprospiraceae bacterium]HMP22938.1 hypothetical protein [Saprospiraceae bacterium]